MRARHRSTVLAGIGTALLCNFWLLEFTLADRNDPADSWISDLAARSGSTGWAFQALEAASGLAVAGFALLLLQRWGRDSPILRRGLYALLAAGALVVIGGGAPLECAEALERGCALSYDPLDVIHASANLAEALATALSFALVGAGLLKLPLREPGRTTIALGALWLSLAVLAGLSYLVDGLDSVNGVFQRGSQVTFGAWLVLLGVWAGRTAE